MTPTALRPRKRDEWSEPRIRSRMLMALSKRGLAAAESFVIKRRTARCSRLSATRV
jgi:hypothetical protein